MNSGKFSKIGHSQCIALSSMINQRILTRLSHTVKYMSRLVIPLL